MTTDGGINRAAEIITKGLMPIIQGLADGQRGLRDDVEGMRTDILEIKYDLRSVVRRQDLTSATKRQHIETELLLGGRCPCCNLSQVVDEDGNKAKDADWDHWFAPHRRGPHETWLVCRTCNQAMKDHMFRKSMQTYFDAYQLRREQKIRPMFKMFYRER